MVDFRAMPPMDAKRRKEQAPKVTKLLNGAAFEFLAFQEFVNGSYRIQGRYLDFAGEWVSSSWDERGKQRTGPFQDTALDWSTARNG